MGERVCSPKCSGDLGSDLTSACTTDTELQLCSKSGQRHQPISRREMVHQPKTRMLIHCRSKHIRAQAALEALFSRLKLGASPRENAKALAGLGICGAALLDKACGAQLCLSSPTIFDSWKPDKSQTGHSLMTMNITEILNNSISNYSLSLYFIINLLLSFFYDWYWNL